MVEVYGFAVRASDDLAIGAHALAVLQHHPGGEDEADHGEAHEDPALAGEVALGAVFGDFGFQVILGGVALPGLFHVGVLVGELIAFLYDVRGERDEGLVAGFLRGPRDVAVVGEPERGAPDHHAHENHASAPFGRDTCVNLHQPERNVSSRKRNAARVRFF